MANTYTQIHIQAVFTVQNRDCIIRKYWKDDLHKYITGIVQNHKHKLLAINGMSDHVHLFFVMRTTQSLKIRKCTISAKHLLKNTKIC